MRVSDARHFHEFSIFFDISALFSIFRQYSRYFFDFLHNQLSAVSFILVAFDIGYIINISANSQQLKEQDEQQKEEVVQNKDEVRVYQPLIPFPQRLKQTKLDDQFENFLNVFRKLEINIPFAKSLAEMPHYAKSMKDKISKKRKLDEKGVVSLSINCSEIIQKHCNRKCKILEASLYPAQMEIMNLGRHFVILVQVSI